MAVGVGGDDTQRSNNSQGCHEAIIGASFVECIVLYYYHLRVIMVSGATEIWTHLWPHHPPDPPILWDNRSTPAGIATSSCKSRSN